MIQVTLHTERGATARAVPETWDELSQEQLIAIAKILFTVDDAMKRDVLLVKALCVLNWQQMGALPSEVIAEHLLPLTEWVVESCDITKQLVPVLVTSKGHYYGPLDHLRNVRFAEWDAAEVALYAWHQAMDDMSLLYEFVAILYRPAKADYDMVLNKEGDVRELFNPHLTHHYRRVLMEEVKPEVAYAILLWYKGCRQFIEEKHPGVFGAEDANKSEIPEEPAYFGMIRAIAKTMIYGDFEKVEQMYIYNALGEMEEAEKERARVEEAIEEAKAGNS